MSLEAEPDDARERTPILRVAKGEPTGEELAALLAVVIARASSSDTTPEPVATNGWGNRAAGLRQPMFAGPGQWSASARPQ